MQSSRRRTMRMILVVEDDARLREPLSRYLAEQGFRVTTARDAAEARDKLRFVQSRPDGAGRDDAGRERPGADRVAAPVEGSNLPVLLLTARGAPEDRIAGFEAGADDYLGKPFEPLELVLRIRALLRRAAPPPATAAPQRPDPAGRCRVRYRARRAARRRRPDPPDRRRGGAADRAGPQAERGAVARGHRRRARHETTPASARSTCR